MSGPRLYNFHTHDVPEEITCLLELLGLWSVWVPNEATHRVYQRNDSERLRWKVQYFKGGTTAEWQRFLSTITGTEHLK